MNSIRYVQNPVEQDPAKLLFNILVNKCKNEKEREAVINKVISSTGGDKTVADTIAHANQQTDSYKFTLSSYEEEANALTDDDFEHHDYDYDGNYERWGGRGEEVQKRYGDAKVRHDLYSFTLPRELQTALDKHEKETDLNQVIELSRKFG